MRHFHFTAALFSAIILASCGGDSNTPRFSSVVSFGDSLSDIGTYSVGTVKALGGGKYTVNDPSSKNWIELMAAKLNVAAPCPAQTGLDGAPALGFAVPVTNFSNCTAYAQGGARVTNPVGPGNKALGGTNAILGQLTVPVATQIQNHLTSRGGAFTGNELVFMMAGANDVFINLAGVGAGGSPAAAVTAMGTAGAELGGYVRNLVIGKGAKYVVVINLPDVSKTPFALAQSAETQGLINTMVTTFNAQLQQGLAGTDVLLVDAYTTGRDQFANPLKYGLTNVTTPACDLTPAKNLIGSSLVCTKNNLIAGATDTYQYADTVHPTPYGYKLLSDLVSQEMGRRGWL